MTYQLLRVEAEVYRAGNEITGSTLINHVNPRHGVAVWVSRTGDLKDVAVMTPEKVTFTGNAVYMRFSAIGLERDTICNGSLDFWSTVKSYEEILGNDLLNIVTAVTKNAKMDGGGIPTITFIAVIDMNEKAGEGRFKGILPLDGTLDPVLVHL